MWCSTLADSAFIPKTSLYVCRHLHVEERFVLQRSILQIDAYTPALSDLSKYIVLGSFQSVTCKDPGNKVDFFNSTSSNVCIPSGQFPPDRLLLQFQWGRHLLLCNLDTGYFSHTLLESSFVLSFDMQGNKQSRATRAVWNNSGYSWARNKKGFGGNSLLTNVITRKQYGTCW